MDIDQNRDTNSWTAHQLKLYQFFLQIIDNIFLMKDKYFWKPYFIVFMIKWNLYAMNDFSGISCCYRILLSEINFRVNLGTAICKSFFFFKIRCKFNLLLSFQSIIFRQNELILFTFQTLAQVSSTLKIDRFSVINLFLTPTGSKVTFIFT